MRIGDECNKCHTALIQHELIVEVGVFRYHHTCTRVVIYEPDNEKEANGTSN